MKRNVAARGPESFLKLKVETPADYAAGPKAVAKALEHSFREMGALRSLKPLLNLNQQEGFDCPSCAWPDPDRPSKIAEYCENGAKALADEATTKGLDEHFFKQHSVESLSLLSDYQINALGRLTQPMVLHPDSVHYSPISWEDAFALIAEKLGEVSNPDEAIFYTSGRSSNEAAFLYGMFVRALGTNNMPDCSNMCHESSGVALSETLGIGKGSVTLEDLYEAEVIVVAGQNPGTNHPRMLSALEKCKKNGGKIISINPLKEAGMIRFKNPQHAGGWIGKGQQIADLHLPVRINQDIPLIKYILKRLLQLEAAGEKVLDPSFIKESTVGFEALKQDLENYTFEELLKLTGLEEAEVETAVSMMAKPKKVVICWAMGLTQHKNGVATIKEYVNLLLAKGAIGKPNAGTCPVRGHSNVQGDRSVGIMHFVNPEFNKRIKEHLNFDPPEHPGLDTVGAMEAMYTGKASVFMALGGNFLSATSDTDYVAAALQNCELTVMVSTKLNRSHLITGKTALILPTFGRSEKDSRAKKAQFVTVENSMGRVRRSQGILKPASQQLMAEPEIVARLGLEVFGEAHPVPWKACIEDYGLIRSYIDKIAKGFSHTEERSKGKGYDLPNNARVGDFSQMPHGKAVFSVCPMPVHDLDSDEFLLMTIRSHDQFNTTIYGNDDRYRGIYNERRVLLMAEKDMKKYHLQPQDVVGLQSNYDGVLREVYNFKVVPYEIPSGNLAAYFPETNPLIPWNQYADKSRTPISKSVKVNIILK